MSHARVALEKLGVTTEYQTLYIEYIRELFECNSYDVEQIRKLISDEADRLGASFS